MKKTNKKLSLRSETVRQLTTQDLRGVAGGLPTGMYCTSEPCPTIGFTVCLCLTQPGQSCPCVGTGNATNCACGATSGTCTTAC